MNLLAAPLPTTSKIVTSIKIVLRNKYLLLNFGILHNIVMTITTNNINLLYLVHKWYRGWINSNIIGVNVIKNLSTLILILITFSNLLHEENTLKCYNSIFLDKLQSTLSRLILLEPSKKFYWTNTFKALWIMILKLQK